MRFTRIHHMKKVIWPQHILSRVTKSAMFQLSSSQTGFHNEKVLTKVNGPSMKKEFGSMLKVHVSVAMEYYSL